MSNRLVAISIAAIATILGPQPCRNQGIIVGPDGADVVTHGVIGGGIAAEGTNAPAVEHIRSHQTICHAFRPFLG